MSQLQSEIPVRSWMTQIITTRTNHSRGRTGSSSCTWTIFRHVLFVWLDFFSPLEAKCTECAKNVIPDNKKSQTQDGDTWSENWKCVFLFYTHNIKETSWILPKMSLTGLWCTRNSNLSGRLWSLTQPSDNPAGQGCILVSVFLHWCSYLLHPIPWWCNVSKALCVCVLLENDTLRQSVLVKLDGLQFQCNPLFVRSPCHLLPAAHCWKQKGKREDHRILKMSACVCFSSRSFLARKVWKWEGKTTL